MNILLYASIAFTVACLIGILLIPVLTRPTAEEARMIEWVNSGRDKSAGPGLSERFKLAIASVVKQIMRTVGATEDSATAARLAKAGFRGADAAELYLAARVIAPLLGVVAASFVGSNLMASIVIGGGIGYVLPDMWLRSRIRARKERLSRSFPDAVDLIVICMDAGLGLDQALLRVGKELAVAAPDISQELSVLNLEQRAGKPRIEAWQSMSDRTEIPEVNAFTSMLIQTDRFGTPILGALARLSNDMRLKRRQHAEEMAAKLKIKILFPLALFIFPCLFIVLLAPALISISRSFGSLAH